MRIVTWNVNGIRSLVKDSQSMERVFAQLKGDVVCFQVDCITGLLTIGESYRAERSVCSSDSRGI